jgi:hypothetical protein
MSQCERRHEARPLAESLAPSYGLREVPHTVCVTTEAHWPPAAMALHLLWSLATTARLNEYNELGIILTSEANMGFLL